MEQWIHEAYDHTRIHGHGSGSGWTAMLASSHKSPASIAMSIGSRVVIRGIEGGFPSQAAARSNGIRPLVDLVVPETVLPRRVALVTAGQRAVAPEPTPTTVVAAFGGHGPSPGRLAWEPGVRTAERTSCKDPNILD